MEQKERKIEAVMVWIGMVHQVDMLVIVREVLNKSKDQRCKAFTATTPYRLLNRCSACGLTRSPQLPQLLLALLVHSGRLRLCRSSD